MSMADSAATPVPADTPYRPDVLIPPPGPGVAPPFAAPPTDGSRKRRWIGLSVGAAALVLCLAGGAVGVGALVVSSEAARKDAAVRVVTAYLTAWQRADYSGAFDLLCENIKDETSLTQFSAEMRNRTVTSFTLRPVELVGTEVLVPVAVRFADDDPVTERFEVVLDTTGNSLVCGTK